MRGLHRMGNGLPSRKLWNPSSSLPTRPELMSVFRSRGSAGHPKIIVKKEPPASPSLQASTRHRPKRLDLNTNTSSLSNGMNSRPSATPMTAGGGLVLHDVGLACLSPGFQTQDPAMREQLERSISVRDQQRSIIQARLLKSARGDPSDPGKPSEDSTGGPKTTGNGSKKRLHRACLLSLQLQSVLPMNGSFNLRR